MKEYINIRFSISEPKATLGTLKLLEAWMLSTKGRNHNNEEKESNKEGIIIKEETKEEETEENINILQLDGFSKLINKYLSFYIKSDVTDIKNLVLNILCLFSNEQWEDIFLEKEREILINRVLISKVSKID